MRVSQQSAEALISLPGPDETGDGD